MCNNVCPVHTRLWIRLISRRYSFVFVDEDYSNYAANFSRRAQSRVITLTNECSTRKKTSISSRIFFLSSLLFFFFFNPDRALTGLNGDRDEIRSRRSTDSIPRPTLRDECLSISRHRALNSSSAWTTSSSRSKFPLERKRDERERELVISDRRPLLLSPSEN